MADNDAENLELAAQLTRQFAAHCRFVLGDSVDVLQNQLLRQEELSGRIDLLHPGSIVLIDDNHLPGGGKPRLAKRRLAELGWHSVLDSQQTLWLPPR